ATGSRGSRAMTTFAPWGAWAEITTTAGVGTHRAALPVIAAVTTVTTVAIGSTIIVAAPITPTAVTSPVIATAGATVRSCAFTVTSTAIATLATGATTIWTTARATLALQLGLRRHFTA